MDDRVRMEQPIEGVEVPASPAASQRNTTVSEKSPMPEVSHRASSKSTDVNGAEQGAPHLATAAQHSVDRGGQVRLGLSGSLRGRTSSATGSRWSRTSARVAMSSRVNRAEKPTSGSATSAVDASAQRRSQEDAADAIDRSFPVKMTAPERIRGRRGVGRAGIEPATSCVSSVRTRLSRGAFPGTVIR